MNTQQGSYNTYIGARYVPIFDGQWDNTKTYEPLVIVEYQGNSYTSKTYVPIGADINNTDYWALTGNYNAQVEAYRQQVQQFQETVQSFDERITTNANNITDQTEKLSNFNLTGKNVHFFGDSFTYGLTKNSQSPNNFPAIFGKVTNANVFNHAVPGATCTTISNVNTLVQVNNTDLSNADYVFYQIGQNDINLGSPIGNIADGNAYFKSALNNTLRTIITKSKQGCKLIVLSILPSQLTFDNFTSPYYNNFYNYDRAITEVCTINKIPCINALETVGITKYNYNIFFETDGHFTDKGYELIGYTIIDVMRSGYSKTFIEKSGDIINHQMLPNDFSIASNFPEYSDIMLNLTTGVKYSLITYPLNKGFYTFSFTLFNANDVNEGNLSVRLIKNIGEASQEIVIVGNIKSPVKGITEVNHTIYVPETYNYTLYFINDGLGSSTIGITNLTLVKGVEPLKATPLNTQGLEITSINNKLSYYGNNRIYVKIENGIFSISGHCVATENIEAGEILLNLPPLGNGFGDTRTIKWLYAVDEQQAKPIMCYFLNNAIYTHEAINNNDRLIFSYCMPFNV